MTDSTFAMMGAGLTLGLIHAFDADHVMAVSAMSSEKPGLLRTLRYTLSWALGHGAVLLVTGLLLFGLGVQLPEPIVHGAEAMVGLVLIGIGLSCFWRFRKSDVRLTPHSHGNITHTHWHLPGHASRSERNNAGRPQASCQKSTPGKERSQEHESASLNPKQRHTPVLVGFLHGLAGSAPALALVPIVGQGQLLVAVGYLLVFSLGVVISMAAFGVSFGALQGKLRHISSRAFWMSRYAAASGSIVLGGYLFVQFI